MYWYILYYDLQVVTSPMEMALGVKVSMGTDLMMKI
jgi:hypothetical protein